MSLLLMLAKIIGLFIMGAKLIVPASYAM